MKLSKIEELVKINDPMTTWGNVHIKFLLEKIHLLKDAIEKHKDIIGESASVADKHLYESLEDL